MGNFQKSKSMDVTLDPTAASRFASYTTAASTSSASKAEEDIPEWKKALLDRRKKEKEKEEEDAKSRNFGFIPGTTLHSSYVNKSYSEENWGSASNLRASSSYRNLSSATDDDAATSSRRRREDSAGSSSSYSWSRPAEQKPVQELTPYEKYLQRKQEQEKKDQEEQRKKEEERREDERRKEREKRREEERKREEELERERAKAREEREKERERKEAEEEERKRKEAEEAKSKLKEKQATPKKWGAPAPAEPKAPEKKRWQPPGSKKVNEEATVAKKNIPDKPSAGFKPSLGSFNETPKSATKKVSLNGSDDESKSNSTQNTNSWSNKPSDKSTSSWSTPSPSTTISPQSDTSNDTLKSELEECKKELSVIKSRNDVLEKLQSEAIKKQPMTFESAKANEATAELMKARETIRGHDTKISEMQ